MDFIRIDDAIICDVPQESVFSKSVIDAIVENTADTMVYRSEKQRRADTLQGKKAEYALETFLADHSDVSYLSYDKFRRDKYKKHAPFDGLLYKNGTPKETLKKLTMEINAEVSGDRYGRISVDMRKKLADNRVFTLEIKSSTLKEKDYCGVDDNIPRDYDAYRRIVKNICKWDFFIFPYYLRTLREGMDIKCFREYAKWVWPRHYSHIDDGRQFVTQMIKDEYDHASDVYTRLYFDNEKNQLYIPGYIMKGEIYKKPVIKRMYSKKSEKTLYYLRSMKYRKSFYELAEDIELWRYDREKVYSELYHGGRLCPECGELLQKRTAVRGPHPGRQFYGCPNYQTCGFRGESITSK